MPGDGEGARHPPARSGALRACLIGQVVLETLDLIADRANRTLTPRYPDYARLWLKATAMTMRRQAPSPDLE